MSYRHIQPTTLLSAGVMTGTDVIHSAALDLLTIGNCAFQYAWDGDAAGAIIVEGSIDGITYDDIGASVSPNPAGVAGHGLLNIVGIQFRYCRLTYTNASGTGTLTVIGSAKSK